MGTLLGFALGFYLGTKAGPDGIDELVKGWQAIMESEDFQALSATAKATLEGLIQQGGAGIGNLLAAFMAGGGESGTDSQEETAHRSRSRDGNRSAASQSSEFNDLIGTGAALVMKLLERGLSSRGF